MIAKCLKFSKHDFSTRRRFWRSCKFTSQCRNWPINSKKTQKLKLFCRSWKIYWRVNCSKKIHDKKNSNNSPRTFTAIGLDESRVNLTSTVLDFFDLKTNNCTINIYVWSIENFKIGKNVNKVYFIHSKTLSRFVRWTVFLSIKFVFICYTINSYYCKILKVFCSSWTIYWRMSTPKKNLTDLNSSERLGAFAAFGPDESRVNLLSPVLDFPSLRIHNRSK